MVDARTVLLTTALTWVLATLFVHLSAKVLMGGSRLVQAFLAVLIGSVLAAFVQIGGGSAGWSDTIVVVLGLGAFALGLAVVYRSSWLKGALLGFVAWILWVFSFYLWNKVFG